MKPFDLAAAKAGAKVVCGNGMPARIVCFDVRSHSSDNMLVVLISDARGEETPTSYHPNGDCLSRNSAFNLRMAPVKREGWVNIYPTKCPGPAEGYTHDHGMVWPTEAKANNNVRAGRVACVHVEWEE